MRIAEIAPASLTVPPQGYGGIELVVALLADGLVDKGHDVTLFASGGSRTRARLISPLPDAPGIDNMEAPIEVSHTLEAYGRSEEFDVIHDHTLLGPAVGAMLDGNPPIIHTLHGPWTKPLRRYYGMLDERVDLVAISHTQQRHNPEIRYGGMVYNGIDLGSYPLREDKEDYLVFLGRSSPQKGPGLAVDVAKQVGMPLRMAVKISEPEERRHWEEHVVPRMSGNEDVHENASHDEKVEILRGGRATLFPIQWEEPFGLVMIESMACGTPVLAFPRGAVLEVIDDGVSGILVEEDGDEAAGVEAMADAIERVGEITPAACRKRVEENFSARSMLTGYEEVFEQALDGRRARAGTAGAGARGRR
jgi:glycosyltransferase involved in cell wall biosynthesis